VEVDRNGLEVLDRDECLRLLRTHTLGRIGLTSGALPTVLPVNFRLVGDRILVRTTGGSKLEAATRNAVVAFEVDDIDPLYHSGWSVVVTGVTREVAGDDVDPADRVRLTRWARGGRDRIVAISTDLVTGRRLRPDRAGVAAGRGAGHQEVDT
jgi:nitroimidazol reductase NimA-like FMN-containing flavoprotein (pyridoxamine 5'-phosphate oxidase superfamily)